MPNSSNSSSSLKTRNLKMNGMTKARQIKLAALIARGYSAKEIAKEMNMSESRIYHLSSEKDPFLNAEVNRILNELFESNDRHLINIYRKALQILDAMLSSPDEDIQYRAIDRIIKIYFTRTGKNPIIQQYFGGQPQLQQPESMDDIILNRRKSRRLPEDDMDSSDSVPDTSSRDASSPASKPIPEQVK